MALALPPRLAHTPGVSLACASDVSPLNFCSSREQPGVLASPPHPCRHTTHCAAASPESTRHRTQGRTTRGRREVPAPRPLQSQGGGGRRSELSWGRVGFVHSDRRMQSCAGRGSIVESQLEQTHSVGASGRAHYRREYLEVLSNRNATSSPLPELAKVAGEELSSRGHSHCPTYVMLPLDTVTVVNTLNLPRALQAGLRALKSVGVDGVMIDVWWGIVEAGGPKQYDWSAYAALVRMVHAAGLKMQAVMSFHGCGGNVGDTCHVSLPGWVLQESINNPDILYTDRAGNRNSEYLSLGVDRLPLFHGRTPLEMYHDFIRSFRDTFSEYMGSTIVEVAVGLGPAGELRFPSYPEGDGRWQYPGIGEFQCYDKYMLASLRACSERVGRPDWGLSGPHDSGSYNQGPDETGFFHPEHGSWRSEYGDFFLSWYSQSLIAHGSRVIAAACQALLDSNVLVAAKLPGIHWWYKWPSHPAELTAGYYNTSTRCGYEAVVRMLARHGALLNFTCVEMGDNEQPWHTQSSPESLLMQVRECCARYGVHMSGENALPRFDRTAHQRIRHNAYLPGRPDLPPLESFTFLRMGETLFQAENWREFVEFINSMDDVYPEHKMMWRDSRRPWRRQTISAAPSALRR